MAHLYLSLFPQALSQLSLKPRGKSRAGRPTLGVRLSTEHPGGSHLLPGRAAPSGQCHPVMPGMHQATEPGQAGQCQGRWPGFPWIWTWNAAVLSAGEQLPGYTNTPVATATPQRGLLNEPGCIYLRRSTDEKCCTLEREIHDFKHLRIHHLARGLGLFPSFTKYK